MKVNREKLVDALEKVAPALGFNILVPEFHYFQIDRNRVQATDGVLLIDTSLPEDVNFSCAVPGVPFLHLLKNLNDEEVELVHKDDTLKVRTDRVKGTFTTAVLKLKETADLQRAEKLSTDLPGLLQGLNYCRFGVSRDETLGPCCGVRVDNNYILSTDRYRIARWDLEESCGVKNSLPLKFIETILKNQTAVSELYCQKDEQFVVILNDGTYIGTSVLVGDYPDLVQYFPTSDNYRGVDLDVDLQDVLERHISFLKNVVLVDKEISVKILKGKCIITSEDKELGTLSEELEISSSKEEEVEFTINPVFLRDIAPECSGFKYYAEKGLVLFEFKNLKYLVQTKE